MNKRFKQTNKKINEMLLFDFLKHLQQTKTEELFKIQYELQMINEDCKQVEDTLDTLNVSLNCWFSGGLNQSIIIIFSLGSREGYFHEDQCTMREWKGTAERSSRCEYCRLERRRHDARNL